MPDTRSKKGKEKSSDGGDDQLPIKNVPAGESFIQEGCNIETPNPVVMTERSDETSSLRNLNISTSTKNVLNLLSTKFQEAVEKLLADAKESNRQDFNSNYRTLAQESARVFTDVLCRISEETKIPLLDKSIELLSKLQKP